MSTTNTTESPNANERFDAFVSYNRPDAADVEFIMQQLHTRGGINYFIDKQMVPGDDWVSLLADKLALAETFLFFIRAIPSKWQMLELNAAISMQTNHPEGKPSIIPVLLPDSPAEAFLGNRNIAFLHQMHAAQFKLKVDELDVIDSLARAISDKSRVWVSSRAFRRPDNLPPSFQADLGGLTDLLIGESVYKSEDICVRELIQNARDACSRVVTDLTPGYRLPEAILVVDEQNRYFDVIDFGDGMSKHALTESFSLLGKSLNPDIERLRRRKQSLENPLTGKFGIGFVSVFMIAERVVVSTKSLDEPCYHFTILRASLPFTFHMDGSRCGRNYPDNGTTVRVYLTPEFATGPKKLNIKGIAENYCRHVPLFFIQEGLRKRSIETDWNTDSTSPILVSKKTDQYEVHMTWATDKNQGIIISNGGFFVRRLEDTVLGGVPQAFISGEINIAPGFVDLNIARDNVVDNEKINALRQVLGDCLSELFEKSLAFVKNVESLLPDEVMRMAATIKKNATIAKELNSADHKIGALNSGCTGCSRALAVAC
jgi:TIR domain-containing protein/histidine kinase/DNA gyrase B/HSP90-like ATPase